MSEEIRILVLDDRPADAELMLSEVRKEGIEFTALRVETERDFRKQLQEYRPSLILADSSLPTCDGMSALAVAQAECSDVPFILVSGSLGEDRAVESLHHGATDYILKERLSRLGAAVRRALLAVEGRHELKRAEQHLRDSEMRYRGLFESARDGILILDSETGMVVDVNPFLTQIVGLSHEQFLGKKVWALGFFKDIVANQANFAELQQKEYIRYEDKPLETADGRRIDVEFVSNTYLVADRKVIQCNIRDITERKRKEEHIRMLNADLTQHVAEHRSLEEKFIEAQKMEVVGRLAAGVAHDFNNILAVIMGYSDVIASDLGPDSPLRTYTEEIRLASERAVGLTRQLLVFSRHQKVRLVVLDLNDIVKDLDAMLRRLVDENIEMKVVPGTHSGRIKADAGYVGQVLMNLVVNARDAMPNGGKLTIATENVTLDALDARTLPGAMPGDYVMLSVSDTGIGMVDEVKGRLFEAFFTTKPQGKGTGLGLTTCHTIVEQSGGCIGVDSELGRGTTFRIYLPRIEQPLDVAAGPIQTGPLPRGTETVLVVEDEPSVRHLATSVLEARGYTVLRAPNGQDALHMVPAARPDLDLLLLDVMMPGLSGFDVLARLREHSATRALPIIMLTAKAQESDAERGISLGANDYVLKPFSPRDLMSRINAQLVRVG